MSLYAHADDPLVRHLTAVAERAAIFAGFFGGVEQARLAGVLHDLGKAEQQFQNRLCGQRGVKEAHAHHGAVLALEAEDRGAPIWPVAFAINGHHAGLHNRPDIDRRRRDYAAKAVAAETRLNAEPGWSPLRRADFGAPLPEWVQNLHFDARQTSEGWRAVDLYTRFLFSALVDADRLDAEEHDPESRKTAAQRRQWKPFDAVTLLRRLDDHIRTRREEARARGASENVLSVRGEVADACRLSGAQDDRVRTLAVPTGGGKTLASMLFALEYARHHPDIRRVIVVIPYLSIIQQTASEFEAAFGDGWVLEHHSQVGEPLADDKDEKRDAWNERLMRLRLAAENWDAPIVVTTSVQFFDSLFSRSPGDARKLHNITQSVIIFDEVQTLPPRLLQPILDVLRELTDSNRPYGCAEVLCTATQPALQYEPADMPFGLRTTEINNRREEHFGRLKRVTFDGLEQAAEPPEMAWSEVAVGLLKTECGLAVVNTRKAARDLFAAVQANTDAKDGVFHLSTWMFPEHRMQVLAEVRRRLDAGVPCRLVSTQCVEAGVDIDFPEVWRAYGPYDSIIQAAGRCNRNGRLASGVVHVFRPKDGKIPSGLYETATMQTDLLRRLGLALPDDPQSFPAYFRLLYQLSVPDDCEVQRERGQLHFEEVSRLFHLIEDHTVPVLVLGYMDGGSRRSTESEAVYAEAARRGFFLRDDWRVLQRHIVNLPRSSAARLTGIASRPDFAPEIELYVLNGDASYRGGLNGCGIDLGAAYEEAIVL